jgi:hypothetical protein
MFDRSADEPKEVRLHSERVDLRVESILSYRKLLPQLSAGWSGDSRVTGTAPALQQRQVLHIFEGSSTRSDG